MVTWQTGSLSPIVTRNTTGSLLALKLRIPPTGSLILPCHDSTRTDFIENRAVIDLYLATPILTMSAQYTHGRTRH
jgi:hypothetical protein